MRDQQSITRVAKLHPKVRDEVMNIIDKIEAGWPATIAVRIVQGLRTIEEQNDLYAQGRTKPGPVVTNAKGGSSFHNYGLAIDFAILYDKDGNGSFETLSWDMAKDGDNDGKKDWMEVVEAFKAAGWEWGGEWHSIKDYPHFQKTFGHTWQQLLAKYKAGQYVEL
jgi:peptidoglycan L-alanyl-D-glutamate endopeptidase CwlK